MYLLLTVRIGKKSAEHGTRCSLAAVTFRSSRPSSEQAPCRDAGAAGGRSWVWPPRPPAVSAQVLALACPCVRAPLLLDFRPLCAFPEGTVPGPDCFVPALPIVMALTTGECEVVGICFARQWFFILFQKEDQLWKARLNHSFHFLMGFGWIE